MPLNEKKISYSVDCTFKYLMQRQEYSEEWSYFHVYEVFHRFYFWNNEM
jgi:hypothetical protein